MAVRTTANARAAMVGPVLVAVMAFRTCWFQARTTLSPVAACAGATPTLGRGQPNAHHQEHSQDDGEFARCHGLNHLEPLYEPGDSAGRGAKARRSSRQTLADP